MNGEHVFDIEAINLQDNPDVLDVIIEACLKRKRELTLGTSNNSTLPFKTPTLDEVSGYYSGYNPKAIATKTSSYIYMSEHANENAKAYYVKCRGCNN